MKNILIFFLFSILPVYSQVDKPVAVEPNRKEENTKSINRKSQLSIEEKKYSVQLIVGNGKGYINILNNKYDPTTSLSEFVALSLFSVAQASPEYAASFTNKLGASSLLALFLINDDLSTSYIRSNSNSAISRFYLENRIKNETIGFQFGLSSGRYAFKADTSQFNPAFLPVAFFGNSNPLLNIYMLQSYYKRSEQIYLGIDTFDFALNSHFLPDSKFDPYLSIGLGFGSCFTNCYALKIFGRAGVRFNLDDYYAFFEQEIQTVLFSVQDKKYSPLQERISLLGFGFYL